MKKLGCLIALSGMLLGTMSVFLFGAAVWRLLHRTEGIAYAVPTSTASEEMEIRVSPGVTHRLVYRAEIVSAEGHFRIAVAWRVRAGDGGVISEGTRDLTDFSSMPTALPSAQVGRPVLVEQPLGWIPASPEGGLKAWIGVTPDAANGERIQHAWLVVSDEASDPGSLALGGAALMALGPMLSVIGFGILLYGFIGRSKPATKPPAQPAAGSAEPPAPT